MHRNCAAVVPALNEEDTISHIVSRTLREIERVVVVDDGSGDKTGERAAQAGAIVLRNARTAGQGDAIMRGLRWAFANGGEHVVILDADGAHDPALIPGLLDGHLSTGADLTIGSRFLEAVDLPSPKRSANIFATGLLNRLMGLAVSDAASGMRVVNGRVASLPLVRRDFAFAFDMILCCRSNGLIIHELPIVAHYNAGELHCTNQAELLCLLNFCATGADLTKSAIRQCAEAAERVTSWLPLSAKINGTSFFFHPLPASKAYVIQQQDPYFKSSPLDGPGDFSSVINL